MESLSHFVVVASFALMLASASAQNAPAPAPTILQSIPGLISGAPGNNPANSNPLPGTGAAYAFSPTGSGPLLPMPPQVTPQVTPQVPTSPSPTPTPTRSPSPTSTPVTPARATTVAFVTSLNLDKPDTFANAIPTQGNPNGLTYAQLWCFSLTSKYTGATCSATATAGSVNVYTQMSFVVTNPRAVSQAADLTSNLQQIASNPSLASNLIPAAALQAFGTLTVSGIQVQAAAGFPVSAPALAPVMAPASTPGITSFSFRVILNYGIPQDFYPYENAWCTNLRSKYPTSTGCQVANVSSGSVVADTEMSFTAGDSAANSMLTQLRDPNQADALFGTSFGGHVVVLSAGGSPVSAASTTPPPPPPSTSHHLSGGKIAGAVIGSVAGAAILGGCGFAGYKYYHTRRAYQPAV